MRRYLPFILIACCGFLPSGNAPPTPPDPFQLTELSLNVAGNMVVNTKTLSFPTLDATDVFLIVAGEGNVGTMTSDKYTPSNPTRVFNINVYDGATYIADDPWLGASTSCGPAYPGGFEGCNTGGWVGQLADAIIAGPHAVNNVFILPIAVYGSTIADWDTGVLTNRIAVAIMRLRSIYSSPDGCSGGPCPLNIYLLWGQGESDHGIAQATYQTALTNIITTARAVLPSGIGQIMPVFVAQQSWLTGATDANIRAAQAAVIDTPSAIYAGPDADTLGATFRQADATGSDNTYWTGSSGTDGVAAYVALWMTALQASPYF